MPHLTRYALLLTLGLGSRALAQLPSLTPTADFPRLRVGALRLDGPAGDGGGVTGLSVLGVDTVMNGQRLKAGTILAALGRVDGGQDNRIYAVDPLTGGFLPDIATTYGPAAADGKPDAGLLLLGGGSGRYLVVQHAPMAIHLGQFEEGGPGRLLDVRNLSNSRFPNGGGIGLLDDDTLLITSWKGRALWKADFKIIDDDLQVGKLQLIKDNLGDPGPDGVAVIPENAPGRLSELAGNLLLTRFSGREESFLDVISPDGEFLQRVATYRKNGAPGLLGLEAVTFDVDGTLYVSDFGRTIFKVTPEPCSALLMVLGGLLWGTRGRRW